jgi:3-hydroxyisobutyrate dehydrogenase-like beta-hydroxyacid dehydrogenase
MPLGLLHPGQMGASVGAAARLRTEVIWAGDGRSQATRERAEAAGLLDVGGLSALCERCEVVLSVCPPAAALELAEEVLATGFRGTFVDANAIAPKTSTQIESLVTTAGADYVDGSLIGPPARKAGTTRLYLAGVRAPSVAALFEGSPLEAVCLEASPPAASELKMCYAGWTKGSAALLVAVRALARRRGVEDALLAEWRISQQDLPARSEMSARRTAPKAWRFSGEMREIAATFADSDLPAGFHEAAAQVYESLAGFRDQPEPELEDVLDALLTEARETDT